MDAEEEFAATDSDHPDYPGLHIENSDSTQIVTLNRGDRSNTLTTEMIGSLLAYFSGLQASSNVNVVILRANGRHFCAGVDLWDWQREIDHPSVARSLAVQRSIGDIVRLMRACPQPIIALAQGAASGGGFSLLMASDIRYGTPDLRMNAAYIKIGLGGCDIGSSYFLPRLVGSSLASELLLTGRFLGAERALATGFLSQIVEPRDLLAAGLSLAAEMTALAPMALKLTKDVLGANLDAPSLDAAMKLEDRQQVMLAMTADHAEAVAAFLEKRPASFVNR